VVLYLSPILSTPQSDKEKVPLLMSILTYLRGVLLQLKLDPDLVVAAAG